MKLIKKIVVLLLSCALLTCLSGCADFNSKAKSNINAYMKNMKALTTDNYITWVNENLGNPYSGYGLELENLRDGQIEYFINCLPKFDYEISSIDETNKAAQVKVTYVDSTEYVTNLFGQLLAFAFSEDYSIEGENQIYLDVMNQIEEYEFVEEFVYFSLNDDASISSVSNNMFDVATTGVYKIMLGDPSEATNNTAKYTAEELWANIEIEYEILDDSYIFVKFTNNNEVPVYPVVNFVFSGENSEYTMYSQANIDVLPAGETNYTTAYNELNDEYTSFELEKEIAYYEPEEITFFDESLIPHVVEQEEDKVSIIYTNNTEEVINICGSYIAYDENGKIIYVGDLFLEDLNPGESDSAWFYLNYSYDETNDTYTLEPYSYIEFYPVAHTAAYNYWCD